MADEYVVKITEQAHGQLQEITHYVAFNLQAPITALRLLDTLEEAIASLAQFPNRIALTEEELWRSCGKDNLHFFDFIIFSNRVLLIGWWLKITPSLIMQNVPKAQGDCWADAESFNSTNSGLRFIFFAV